MAETPKAQDTPAQPPYLTPQEMSSVQLREWERTGTAPDRVPKAEEAAPAADTKPADQPAEAAAAQPGDQAASTDALSKAATETAVPEKKPGKKLTAKERADEIERETKADEERLQAALRRRREVREALAHEEREAAAPKQVDKKAESTSAAPAPGEPAWKKYAKDPNAPK